MRTMNQILENLNEEQKQLLADTINHGSWGNSDAYFKGDDKPAMADGYITDLAHKGNHFERKSLSNRFRSLFKALGLEGTKTDKNSAEMQWMYDWWQDGSGSILLIREELSEQFEEWAKNYNKPTQEEPASEWIRYYVVVDFPDYKHQYSFSGKDKEQLFIDCVNFASGFIDGYVVTHNDGTISTNACQSIDGFIWWNTITHKNVVYITDEKGELRKK